MVTGCLPFQPANVPESIRDLDPMSFLTNVVSSPDLPCTTRLFSVLIGQELDFMYIDISTQTPLNRVTEAKQVSFSAPATGGERLPYAVMACSLGT